MLKIQLRERIMVKWFKFEEPRIEQIQDLENDVMKYFREDLHRQLLSTDFKNLGIMDLEYEKK